MRCERVPSEFMPESSQVELIFDETGRDKYGIMDINAL
jgi:hypothetical protein